MQLATLFQKLSALEPQTQAYNSLNINNLSINSRTISHHDVFIALTGSQQHGLYFAEQAINKGAAAILYDPEQDGRHLASTISAIPTIAVPNLSTQLGLIAANFYGWPTDALTLVGITGTNGKTSCTQFLHQLTEHSGVIGTLGWGDRQQLHATQHTTPDALTLQKIFSSFKNNHQHTVFMEVSSHAISQHRTSGLPFEGIVFTNITRDHLDYHLTFSAYCNAKLQLLDTPDLRFVVMNLDDELASKIISRTPATAILWSTSCTGKTLHTATSLVATQLRQTPTGIAFDVHLDQQQHHLSLPLYGLFNVSNCLQVLAVLLAKGMSFSVACQQLKNLQPIQGRMERLGGHDQPHIVIDYAHTPDALEKALSSLRAHCQHRLWLVFGCGGNRDQGKRPLMGECASRFADQIILTDDNPRDEASEQIIADIMTGCEHQKTRVIANRELAIHYAIAHASPKDCILIAGKGHEDYQESAGERFPFSDKECALHALTQTYPALGQIT